MEKKCFKCGILKPLNEFYKHKAMKDGHLNKCIDCTVNDSKKHREENLEKVKLYDRKRGQTEKRKQLNKEYKSTMKINDPKKWNDMCKKHIKNYRSKHRQKYLAVSKLAYALKSGKIKREPCNFCGSEQSEAHHIDYSRPLFVIWLCDYHHKEMHKLLRSENRKI